jgi:hypothetical protein
MKMQPKTARRVIGQREWNSANGIRHAQMTKELINWIGIVRPVAESVDCGTMAFSP